MNSRGMMNGCTQAPGGSGSGGPNGMYMNGMQPYMYDTSGMDQSQMSMPFTHYGSMMGSSGLGSMDGSAYGHHFFGGMAQQQQQQQQMLLQQQQQNMAASVYGSMGGSFSDQMSMASHYQSGVGMGHYLNGGASSYAHYPQQQQQIPPSVRPTPTPQPNPQEIADSIYHMASSAYRAPVPSPLAAPSSRSAQHQTQQLPPQTQSQQSQSQQPLQQASHHHQQQQQAHSMSAAPLTPLGSGGGHAASNGSSAAAAAGVGSMVSMPGCYSPGPPYGRSSGMLSPPMGVTQQQPRAAGAPGSSSSSSSHPSPTAAGGTSGPMSPLSIRSPPLSAVPSVHSAGGGGGNLAGQLSPGSVRSANSPGLTPPPHVLAQSHLHRSSPSSSHLLALHGASPSSSSGMAAAAGSMYSQGVVRPQHTAMPRLHAQQMGTPGQMAGSDGGVMVPSGMFGNPLQSLERLALITDKYPVDPKSIVSGSSMHDPMSLYHHQSPMVQQQLPVHLQQQQQQSSAAHSYAMYGMQQQPGAGSHYQSSLGSGYATAMPPHLQPAGDYAKLEPAERPKTSASHGKKSGGSRASSHAASSSGGKGKSAGAGKKSGAAGKIAAQSPQAGEDGVSRKVGDESGSGGDGMGFAGQLPSGGSNSFQPSPLGVASSTAGGDGRARAVYVTADAASTGLAASDATNIVGARNSGSPSECTLQSLLSVPPGRSPPHYQLHPQKNPADVGGSATGPTAMSPKAAVIASHAASADEGHLGLGAAAYAAAQSLSSSRDKEDGPQRILSPMRPPQSPAMADLASAASAGSGSSADSVGSSLREDRCALEAEADGMLLPHETCAPTDSPVVGDTSDCKKANGSSVRGGDESCRADVDAAGSRDSEHTDLTVAASAVRDSSDCAKPLQHSATARRDELRGGTAVTAALDSAEGTGASDAAMAAAKHRSTSSLMPPDPFSADASGSSAVASSLHTSVSGTGVSAAAPAAGGLAAAARGTLLTGIFGAAAPGAAAAVAAVSATAAGIDYSNCKNVPLRKRKPGLPPSADASTRACGPLVAPSTQVLSPLPPPLLQRDPAAPAAKKPRALGLLKKPPSFSVVASDGSSGSGRSTVTLSPSVLAAAAAAHRTPERGEPPPPHLEKAVSTPVKAEYPERKDSRASGGPFTTALPPSPGSAAAGILEAGTTSPPLREQPHQRRRRSSSSSDASPAAALTSQRRPAAVAALSLLVAESRSSGGGVPSAKSDVTPSAPVSGLRSLMLGSVLPVKSSVPPSSMEATGGSALLGGRNSGATSSVATAMLPPSADGSPGVQPEVVKRKRGRPLGSKNKKKDGLSYKSTKKDRAKPGTTPKRSAAAVAAAAIASLEVTGRAGRTSAAAGQAVPASHSAVAGQQTPKSALVAAAGSVVADSSKLGTPSHCLVVGGVKVEVVAAAASPFATVPVAAAAGSAARTAVADAAAERSEVRVASFTKVGRVKEMSPRGQQMQQQPQQHHLTAVPLNVSARSLAAADDSPWLCVFCHEVSNFKSLGDLFGPYRIVGASPCSPGPTAPGQFCQPLRPVASVAAPAAADAVEPVKRGRPSSAAKASPSSTSAAAARRSTAGGTSPSAAGGEWRPATEGGGGRLRTVWYHEDCAVWAPGVNLVGQQLVGLDEAVAVGEQSFCTRCKRNGALLGCYCKGCSNKYHYYCAIEDGCTLTEENFSTVCPRHSARVLAAGNASGVAQAGAVTKGAATTEASLTRSEMSGTPKKKPRY